MARTQKNKATSYHLGTLKAKIAKLRRELFAPSSGGKAGEGFEVKRPGNVDARVGLVGKPSVGKSSLLTKLTGTFSEAASYEFTTLTCIPGTFKYKGCKIQLLDLPGIIEGAKDGKGRGRQVIAVARTCDLILITLDASKPMTEKKIIEYELEGFGIRLNKKPADIIFKKKERGGVHCVFTQTPTHLDKDLVQMILKEYRVSNADVTFRCDATVEELIDVLEANRAYIPCIYVLNKIDSITIEELDLLAKIPHHVPISARDEWNLDSLLEEIDKTLGMARIYTKPKGQVPDYNAPVIMPASKSTVEEFCKRIHRDLLPKFKYASVWGKSVKHNPQKVGKDHLLYDEDVVQLVLSVK